MRQSILLIMLLLSFVAKAYDFTALSADGQTLYFDSIEGGVKLTFPNANATPTQAWMGYTMPTGVLTIPATVSFDGRQYSVIEIGNHALYNCNALTSITLSNGVTAIGASAFYGCSTLSTLHLPSSITSIGSQAFRGCGNLTDLYLSTPTPPDAQYAFYNCDLSGTTLHVPCDAMSLYSDVEPWSTFGDLMCEVPEATITLHSNDTCCGSVAGGGTYAIGSLIALQATPKEGCFLACWNDGDTTATKIITVSESATFTAFFYTYRHDTVYAIVTEHDTVAAGRDTVVAIVHIYDTVRIRDTVMPMSATIQVLSANQTAGIGIGNSVLPIGCEVEIGALPFEGYHFLSWSDGNVDNPRHIVVDGNAVYVATFETAGTGSPAQPSWHATVRGKTIVVDAPHRGTLSLYDITGRRLLTMPVGSAATTLQVESPGAYLLQLDNGAARRIIIQ